jgi:diguanylate cyclase (GGDEF)-like protein
LTGITNRLGWEEALASEQARAARRGLWTGVVSVDLDELKQMNDRFGHHAGDALLLAAAESLQAVVRREDVLARVGGDEFAVLVSDCDADCLDRLITRLRTVLDTVGVRASVGAVSVPTGTSLQEAWQVADREMYAEKHGLGHRQLDLDLTDEALRTG